MKYKYRFDPIAANEYEAAYSWYIERSANAAENFISAIDEAVDAICTNPHPFNLSTLSNILTLYKSATSGIKLFININFA